MRNVLKRMYLVFALPLMVGIGVPQLGWAQAKPYAASTVEQAQQNPAGQFIVTSKG